MIVISQVSAVVALLPAADFYIVEKPSITVQNTSLFPITAHMRAVEAMLFALLEPRNSQPEANIPPRLGKTHHLRKCDIHIEKTMF